MIMLIEWFWKCEYFINLRKMVHSAKIFSKNDIIY